MKTYLSIPIILAACGSSSTTNPAIDAPISMVDAASGTPDGPISAIDVKPGTPDSKPAIDAPATVADGPVAPTCIPQCVFDAILPLAIPCPTSGTCTTSTTVDASGITTTRCYASTKVVTQISSSGIETTTFKNASGTCYTMTTSMPTETSGKTVWRDGSGTQVVELDIPNISVSNIVDYICGGGAPIQVDLNSTICQQQGPDGGPGPDGGTGCTMSASCTP